LVCPASRFTAGRPDENPETAKKENAAGEEWLDLQADKTADEGHEEKGRKGESRIGEEHGEKLFKDITDDAH
jgi:hypothetical protein